MKKLILIAFSIFLVAVVAGLLVQGSAQGSHVHHATGVVVHKKQPSYEFWGIQAEFSLREPFRKRKLRFENLPIEYQLVGTRVEVNYSVADVIGTADWDVVIKIESIHATGH